MRKFILLIPAMLLTLAMNAAVININNETADALRVALNNAADGDEIVMAAGTYVESNSNYIAFAAGKSIIVRAADGANVILKPHVPITIAGGARAEIKGIKIDASELCSVNSYSHLMYPSDGADNNRLILDSCEIYGYAEGKAVIASRSSNKLDSLIINNCKFYNHTTRSCVFLENTANIGLIVTNSTFYNIATGTESFGAGIIDNRSTTAKVRVDHCTFYNVVAQSTDYAAIGKIYTSDAIVSNCIFAMPTSTDNLRTIWGADGGGTKANNCMVYNYIYDSNLGMRSAVVQTDCSVGNPLFVDAANADFSLHTASPARGAGTEGSDLGASCWTKEVNPSTDFSSSLVLPGADAILAKNIEYTAEYYLKSKNKDDAEHVADHGTATWKFHATKACNVQVTVNLNPGNDKGHNYSAEIFDNTNASMGTVAQIATRYNDEDKTLIGMIELPAAGDYSIVLSNNQEWSEAIIHGITLAYGGGDVTDVPDDLDIADALHNGTRADGVISFADATTGWAKWNIAVEDEAFYDITISIKNQYEHNITATIYEEDGETVVGSATKGNQSSSDNVDGHSFSLGGVYMTAGNYVLKVTNARNGSDAKIMGLTLSKDGGAVQAVPGTAANSQAWFSNNGTRADGKISFSTYEDAWVKWNLSTTAAGNYNVKLYVENTTELGHRFVVHLYEADGAEGEPLYSETWNSTYNATDPLELDCGTFTFAANKKYILKVTNTENGSHAKVINVVTSYVNGGLVDLSLTDPVSLPFEDVILSDDWSIADGKITHAESKALTGWAKWNVNSVNYANYNVTVNISSDNGHGVRVEVFEDEAAPALYTLDEASSTHHHYGNQAIDLGNITLSDREYVVKVSNTVGSSHVQIASVVITYVNGARITLPATLDPDDAELSALAYVESDKLYFTPADKSGYITDQWAKWNVKVAETGTFLFTMNVSSTNSQSYKLSIKDGESNVVAEFEKNPGSGAQEMKFYPYLTAGNYTVEVQNTYQYSEGYMVSLEVTEPASLLVLDEAAENNSVIHDNYRNGNHDIQIIRTIVKDMYNTICLPFDVEAPQLKEIFGKDVVLKQMESATLEEEGMVLNLNFVDATSIYRGRPYIIKTSRNIVNPTFQTVEIKEEVGQATNCTNANFVGNFVAGTILADENNLFMGANNTLYFPTVDTEILGMRAYFAIHDAPAGVIQRARIVEADAPAITTEINCVDAKANGSVKTIENGQLVIIRDGKKYNVMGVRMK